MNFTLTSNTKYIIFFVGIVVITVILATAASYSIGRYIKRHADQETYDPTTLRFVVHILVAIIYVVGLCMAVYVIPSFRHIATTLLTGAGILTAVIGFASQQALSNVISGIFIMAAKPYRINNTISVGNDLQGVVEDIGLRNTVIRNFQNKRIIIPNSLISSQALTNADHTDHYICKWIEVGVAYHADIRKAKGVMQEEVSRHPNFIDRRTKKQITAGEESVIVRVVAMGNFSVTLRAWAWAANNRAGFIMYCDLLESIKERFDTEGIEIPYPYQNTVLQNVPNQSITDYLLKRNDLEKDKPAS